MRFFRWIYIYIYVYIYILYRFFHLFPAQLVCVSPSSSPPNWRGNRPRDGSCEPGKILIQVKTPSFPIGKIEVFWRGKKTKIQPPFRHTLKQQVVFLKNSIENWMMPMTTRILFLERFDMEISLEVFCGPTWECCFQMAPQKTPFPPPKSTPPTASVVSPPAWCNYLKWKMTPPPMVSGWFRWGFLFSPWLLLGGPSCRKNLVPRRLGVFLVGKKPQPEPNDSPK